MNPRLNFFKANPKTMAVLANLEQQIANSGLEKNLIELVRLRASQINGCAYCIDVHTADARKADETDRRLALLPVWRESNVYSDRERAAFAWAEAITLVADSHVPDEAWELARQQFQEAELVDLTLLVTTINTWNRFAIAFRKVPI